MNVRGGPSTSKVTAAFFLGSPVRVLPSGREVRHSWRDLKEHVEKELTLQAARAARKKAQGRLAQMGAGVVSLEKSRGACKCCSFSVRVRVLAVLVN